LREKAGSEMALPGVTHEMEFPEDVPMNLQRGTYLPFDSRPFE